MRQANCMKKSKRKKKTWTICCGMEFDLRKLSSSFYQLLRSLYICGFVDTPWLTWGEYQTLDTKMTQYQTRVNCLG